MSSADKQRISGGLCVCSAFVMAFCIWRMIPYGMAGEADKAKVWFIPVIIVFFIGSLFGVAYYYYRSLAKKETGIERLRAEATILAAAGHKVASSAPAPPQPSHPEKETDSSNWHS